MSNQHQASLLSQARFWISTAVIFASVVAGYATLKADSSEHEKKIEENKEEIKDTSNAIDKLLTIVQSQEVRVSNCEEKYKQTIKLLEWVKTDIETIKRDIKEILKNGR